MAYSRKTVSKMMIEPNALELLGLVESKEEIHCILDAVCDFFKNAKNRENDFNPKELTDLSRAGEKAYSALISCITEGIKAFYDMCDRQKENSNGRNLSSMDNHGLTTDNLRTTEGTTERRNDIYNKQPTEQTNAAILALEKVYGKNATREALRYASQHATIDPIAYAKKRLEATHAEPTTTEADYFDRMSPEAREAMNETYARLQRIAEERETKQE